MKDSTRAEHLQWCKDRAIEILDTGDVGQSFASFASDMSKHDDTKGHSALELGVMMMFGGQLSGVDEMKKFIEGFN